MMIEFMLYSIVLVALFFASLSDIRTREVPDWISYFLIAAGAGIRAIYSLLNWDFWIILEGIIGFSFFFAIAMLMYYTRQWGGGDSKVLMGMGACLGLDIREIIAFKSPFAVNVFVDILLAGAFYGIIYSAALAIRNFRKVKIRFAKIDREKIKEKRIFLLGSALLALLAIIIREDFLKLAFASFAGIVIIMFYLNVFIKSVEKECMLRKVSPENLTIGDWIAEKVVVDRKTVIKEGGLGVEEKDIKKLILLKKNGKLKMVTVKDGMPFLPSFLLGYVLALLFGNLFMVLLN